VCSDGELVCLCDGTVIDHSQCLGFSGHDWDASGSCELTGTQFACGHKVCEGSEPGAYCYIEISEEGGTNFAGCNSDPKCDPATCECLGDVCFGTCEEIDGVVTVTCE
jgi:hypothetical protein